MPKRLFTYLSADFSTFCVALTHELRRIHVQDADASGYIERWGWRFPTRLYGIIEARALEWGYVPRSASEIASRPE